MQRLHDERQVIYTTMAFEKGHMSFEYTFHLYFSEICVINVHSNMEKMARLLARASKNMFAFKYYYNKSKGHSEKQIYCRSNIPSRNQSFFDRIWTPTWSWYWFKELLNLWCTPGERSTPEVVPRILLDTKHIDYCSEIHEHRMLQVKIWSCTFISSMNVIRRPHGWGRLTIRRSNRTLVICSWIASWHQH